MRIYRTMKDNERYNTLLNRRKRLDPVKKEVIEAIIESLEARREKEHFSCRKFSTLLGLSETHYPKILEGKRQLSLSALLTFLWVFEVDPRSLFGDGRPDSDDAVGGENE